MENDPLEENDGSTPAKTSKPRSWTFSHFRQRNGGSTAKAIIKSALGHEIFHSKDTDESHVDIPSTPPSQSSNPATPTPSRPVSSSSFIPTPFRRHVLSSGLASTVVEPNNLHSAPPTFLLPPGSNNTVPSRPTTPISTISQHFLLPNAPNPHNLSLTPTRSTFLSTPTTLASTTQDPASTLSSHASRLPLASRTITPHDVQHEQTRLKALTRYLTDNYEKANETAHEQIRRLDGLHSELLTTSTSLKRRANEVRDLYTKYEKTARDLKGEMDAEVEKGEEWFGELLDRNHAMDDGDNDTVENGNKGEGRKLAVLNVKIEQVQGISMRISSSRERMVDAREKLDSIMKNVEKMEESERIRRRWWLNVVFGKKTWTVIVVMIAILSCLVLITNRSDTIRYDGSNVVERQHRHKIKSSNYMLTAHEQTCEEKERDKKWNNVLKEL